MIAPTTEALHIKGLWVGPLKAEGRTPRLFEGIWGKRAMTRPGRFRLRSRTDCQGTESSPWRRAALMRQGGCRKRPHSMLYASIHMCVYVYIYVYIHIYVGVCLFIYTGVYMHVYIHLSYLFRFMCLAIYIGLLTYMSMYSYACSYSSSYTYSKQRLLCICMHG